MSLEKLIAATPFKIGSETVEASDLASLPIVDDSGIDLYQGMVQLSNEFDDLAINYPEFRQVEAFNKLHIKYALIGRVLLEKYDSQKRRDREYAESMTSFIDNCGVMTESELLNDV